MPSGLRALLTTLLVTTILPRPAAAMARDIALAPSCAQIGFTTYAMGVVPLSGHFTRFTGQLHADAAHPEACTISLDVDVASLRMSDPGRVVMALGPGLLDQTTYPHLLFQGTCRGATATGLLTLHGTTRPFTLHATSRNNLVTAQGTLRRQDFGIDGSPHLIGHTIAISLTVTLPGDLAKLVPP